jgi:hypothetical protein
MCYRIGETNIGFYLPPSNQNIKINSELKTGKKKNVVTYTLFKKKIFVRKIKSLFMVSLKSSFYQIYSISGKDDQITSTEKFVIKDI